MQPGSYLTPSLHQPQGVANKAPRLAPDFCLQAVSGRAINPQLPRPKIEGGFASLLPRLLDVPSEASDGLQLAREAFAVLITTDEDV